MWGKVKLETAIVESMSKWAKKKKDNLTLKNWKAERVQDIKRLRWKRQRWSKEEHVKDKWMESVAWWGHEL